MADNLQPDQITEIRERKGMKTELPEAINYF
jgi:elongation factor 2